MISPLSTMISPLSTMTLKLPFPGNTLLEQKQAADTYRRVRRLLVCGSRTFPRERRGLIRDELRWCHPDTVVMHGGQGTVVGGIVMFGTDLLAGEVATGMGMEVEEYPAQWSVFGPSAGPRRNAVMIEKKPQLVLAFWDGLSPGTRDCLSRARQASIPCKIVSI